MTPAPQQCENCILVGTRACMYHGYPEDTIPSSCQYKIGTGAEEALECLKGTSIISNLLKQRSSTTSAEVLEKVKDLAWVRIAQGIGGLSFDAMLSYLSKSPEELQDEIAAVCKNSGMTVEELKEHAKRIQELRQRGEREQG